MPREEYLLSLLRPSCIKSVYRGSKTQYIRNKLEMNFLPFCCIQLYLFATLLLTYILSHHSQTLKSKDSIKAHLQPQTLGPDPLPCCVSLTASFPCLPQHSKSNGIRARRHIRPMCTFWDTLFSSWRLPSTSHRSQSPSREGRFLGQMAPNKVNLMRQVYASLDETKCILTNPRLSSSERNSKSSLNMGSSIPVALSHERWGLSNTSFPFLQR